MENLIHVIEEGESRGTMLIEGTPESYRIYSERGSIWVPIYFQDYPIELVFSELYVQDLGEYLRLFLVREDYSYYRDFETIQYIGSIWTHFLTEHISDCTVEVQTKYPNSLAPTTMPTYHKPLEVEDIVEWLNRIAEVFHEERYPQPNEDMCWACKWKTCPSRNPDMQL